VTALKKHYKVITYDLRGYGKSSLPQVGRPYSHVQDFATLLDYLKIENPIICAHSFGGNIALDYAVHNLDKFRASILPESSMTPADLELKPEFGETMKFISDSRKAARTKGVEDGKKVLMESPLLSPAMKNKKAASVIEEMEHNYSGWHWLNKDPDEGFSEYKLSGLLQIKVPVLILYGSLSSKGYAMIAELQHQYLTNSNVIKIENASHALNLENPKQVNAEIKKFLKENKF
jgi:pimeloyl-ACP methyl ester carboxylesterase